MFPGGVVRVVGRPHVHYYDMHVRPPLFVESYDPVDGYAWVGGNWRWGGAEWVWMPGYYSVAAVAPTATVVVPAPPSVSVSAGVSIY